MNKEESKGIRPLICIPVSSSIILLGPIISLAVNILDGGTNIISSLFFFARLLSDNYCDVD